jgi:PD-(D/E)XK nuclease superfamily
MTANLPILRTSERAAFKRCPRFWWWAYREGWTPKVKQADALWFGIGIHEALAQWYKKGTRRGPHPADTFAEWAGDEIAYAKTYLTESFDEPVWEDTRELGIAMLEEYEHHWGKDSQWDIIAIESSFRVKITSKGQPIAIFRSRWDGVLRDKGDSRIYLLEHKTANQVVTAYLELDDQAGAYWAVAGPILRARGVLKESEEIAGIVYNFLRKRMPDKRPRNAEGLYLNKNGSVSKQQPLPQFVREYVLRSPHEHATQMQRLADEVTIMSSIRAGELPVIKNPTKECIRCAFLTPCKLHERGGTAYKTVLKADFVQKNPYEDTRESSSLNGTI